MEEKEASIEGRKYKVLVSPDEQQGGYIILGPPEGLVDSLGLPEPFATTLHNILYDRGMLNYKAIVANQKNAVGVMQEALNIDAQRLVEAFRNFENDNGG